MQQMLHYAEKQVEINKTLERAFSRCQITRLKRKDTDLENHNSSVLPNTNND
jgi:hypothetical protein